MKKVLGFLFIAALVTSWVALLSITSFAQEPSITTVSGEITDTNILSVTGTGFGSRFDGLAEEYFDDFDSEVSYSVNGQLLDGDGHFSTAFFGADTDNCVAGGDFHQLEHLGWGVAIKKGASCYSTGYGYRRALGAIEPGQPASSGDNYGIDVTIPEQTGPVWVSFMVRYNSVGRDSNVSFPLESTLAGLTDFSEKIARIFDKSYGSSIADIYWKKNVWIEVSGCGTNVDLEWRSDRNHEHDYPASDDPIQAGALCNDYSMPDSIDTWMRIVYMIDVNSQWQSDGEIRYYMDKGRGLALLYRKTNIDCGQAGDDLAADYVKIGGNHSGTQQYFLTSGNGKNATYDYDDIIVSTTEPKASGCVYLSSQSTWGGGVTDRWNGDSAFVRQRVGGSGPAEYGFKSWSDTQLKFEVNLGNLDVSQPIYLYVTNWNGETNADGYPLLLPEEEEPLRELTPEESSGCFIPSGGHISDTE